MDLPQDSAKMLYVLLAGVAVDHHVIQVSSTVIVTVLEDLVHQPLESRRGPMKAVQHNLELEQTHQHPEGSVGLGLLIQGHLPVPFAEIQCGHVMSSTYSLQ